MQKIWFRWRIKKHYRGQIKEYLGTERNNKIINRKIHDFESKAPVVNYKSYADARKASISDEIKVNFPVITVKPKQSQLSK